MTTETTIKMHIFAIVVCFFFTLGESAPIKTDQTPSDDVEKATIGPTGLSYFG